MRYNIKADEKTLNYARERLGDFQKQAPAAVARALNRATTNVNSNIKKEARQVYHIKAADIQKTLTRTRATKSRLGSEVRSTGGVIPLDKFKITPKTVNPRRKTPIKAAVKKSGGPKAITGAFMADINGVKAFERVSEFRLPIRRLYGPSVPQMLENEQVADEINQLGQKTFDQRLEHEISRILEKGKA